MEGWNYVDLAIYILYIVFFIIKHLHDSDSEEVNEIPDVKWIVKYARH